MTNLVLVESPAKCAKIQGFLGPGWKVLASVGHIRHLQQSIEAVGIHKNFEATWEWMSDKAKVCKQLKEAAQSATQIYFASDDDREGELIAYSVALLVKVRPETSLRIVFHEITESAVKHAIAHPRTIDMNKVHAAEARAMLDMMVGFTLSPLLWKKIGPALSAGRCQTPALRLVADREKEINNFQAVSSWITQGTWGRKGSKLVWPAKLLDELEDEESAVNYLENHHTEQGGVVRQAETKPWTERPPPPLVTSSLQQVASAQFRLAPKRTMQIAQRLYEAGHITYMRTDKATLSEEAVEAGHKYVRIVFGEEYIGQHSTTPPTQSKKQTSTQQVKAQEAHEAIRPTDMTMLHVPSNEEWSPIDRKVYDLIWKRAMQSVMASARGEQRTVRFVADGDTDEWIWSATWRRTLFPGWRRIGELHQVDEEDEHNQQAIQQTDDQVWQEAEQIKPGTLLQWQTLQAEPHTSKAPPRYTEATLIRELEAKGIGRPSTFASLLGTILEKSYVEQTSFPVKQVDQSIVRLTKPNQWPPETQIIKRSLGGEKDRLTVTPLGSSVLTFLVTQFEDIFAYDFTAGMETRLDKIARAEEPWKQLLADCWNQMKDRVETMSNEPQATKQQTNRRSFGTDGLLAVLTKKGPLLLKESPDANPKATIFYGWPSSNPPFHQLTEDDARAFVATAVTKSSQPSGKVLGELDGFPIHQKQGKFGTYVEWNGKTASCQATDTLETIKQKLQGKGTQRTVGNYTLRVGPYGPYMIHNKAPKTFIKVPSTLDFDTVTEPQCEAIYKEGVQEQKKHSGPIRGGFRGGFRGGRGGFRGGRGRGRGQ